MMMIVDIFVWCAEERKCFLMDVEKAFQFFAMLMRKQGSLYLKTNIFTKSLLSAYMWRAPSLRC
jgi:hypothetical protein